MIRYPVIITRPLRVVGGRQIPIKTGITHNLRLFSESRCRFCGGGRVTWFERQGTPKCMRRWVPICLARWWYQKDPWSESGQLGNPAWWPLSPWHISSQSHLERLSIDWNRRYRHIAFLQSVDGHSGRDPLPYLIHGITWTKRRWLWRMPQGSRKKEKLPHSTWIVDEWS